MTFILCGRVGYYLLRCEAAAGLAPLHVWLHRTSYQEVLVNKKFLAVAATLISF